MQPFGADNSTHGSWSADAMDMVSSSKTTGQVQGAHTANPQIFNTQR